MFLEIAAHKLYDVGLRNLTRAAFNGEELYDSNRPLLEVTKRNQDIDIEENVRGQRAHIEFSRHCQSH